MKKQIKFFIIAASFTSMLAYATQTSFKGLQPFVEECAEQFNASASLLPVEKECILLHLFVDPTLMSMESTMKCIQTIQSDPVFAPQVELLQKLMVKIIDKYFSIMEKKFKKRYINPTEQDIENFNRTLEHKIFGELNMYIFQIFYNELYKHIASKDATKLVIMFNDNGIIEPSKRTNALPQPSMPFMN